MKRFFNSPWLLLIPMLLGAVVAKATSVSFIFENEIDDQVQEGPLAQLPSGERQP